MVDRIAALERLAALHLRGALTDEEFSAEKDRLELGTAETVAPLRSASKVLLLLSAIGVIVVACIHFVGRTAEPSQTADVNVEQSRAAKKEAVDQKSEQQSTAKVEAEKITGKPTIEKILIRVNQYDRSIDQNAIGQFERMERYKNCQLTGREDQVAEEKLFAEIACEKRNEAR